MATGKRSGFASEITSTLRVARLVAVWSRIGKLCATAATREEGRALRDRIVPLCGAATDTEYTRTGYALLASGRIATGGAL